MKKIIISLIAVSILAVFAASSNAELFDRGYGLIYDDAQDITWYDNPDLYEDGTMEWADAVIWADELVVQGYNDWRLPVSDTCSGSDCTVSEMGHLFYIEGVTSDSPGLFTDVRPSIYWSGTGYDEDEAWRFNFKYGTQGTSDKGQTRWVWAVRKGDSVPAVVPEPASSILFLTGGILFISKRYWKKCKKDQI